MQRHDAVVGDDDEDVADGRRVDAVAGRIRRGHATILALGDPLTAGGIADCGKPAAVAEKLHTGEEGRPRRPPNTAKLRSIASALCVLRLGWLVCGEQSGAPCWAQKTPNAGRS
ncbi:hypothetical protein GCM10025774_13470 [Microbacterium kyungheense]